MIHPTPPGTRDILPEEMRELRALEAALRDAFEERGYGEVATPTIEYAEVLRRGDERYANAAYRFFDERGDLLALRSDMTIPIARLVATRLPDAEPPFRLCYLARAYRAVSPQRGQMREFTQAGVELIGAPAPEGTAEVIEVLSAALDAAGLTGPSSGSATLISTASSSPSSGSTARRAIAILDRLATHDLVGLEAGGRRGGGAGRRGASHLLALPAAARRPRGPRRGPRARRGGRRAGHRAAARDLRVARAPAASPTVSGSTSACCATSATTPARSSRSTTRRSATSSAAAAATTSSARALRPRPAGGRLRALPGAAARRPDRGGAPGRGGGRLMPRVAAATRAREAGR